MGCKIKIHSAADVASFNKHTYVKVYSCCHGKIIFDQNVHVKWKKNKEKQKEFCIELLAHDLWPKRSVLFVFTLDCSFSNEKKMQ